MIHDEFIKMPRKLLCHCHHFNRCRHDGRRMIEIVVEIIIQKLQ